MSNSIKDYIANIKEDIEGILTRNAAVISGAHLVLTSNDHSDGYINLRKLAGKSVELATIGGFLGEAINLQVEDAEYKNNFLLVGPETMGRSFAHEAAYSCNDTTNTDYVWCEPNADKTAMQWNAKLDFAERITGQHCIIVDDVITTATTLKQTVELIKASGGIVEGAIVVVRRNASVTAEAVGIPWLIALYEVNLQNYHPDHCPLCAQKVPMILRPGHGHSWIKEHPDYPVAK